MKFPFLPIDSFKLINQSFKRVKQFALIKMSELKRSLEAENDSTGDQSVKRAKKIKNRKFALMLCYSGNGYYGLQR